MSLADLSEKTSLTKSYLSKIERGERRGSAKSARVIADALGVDVSYIIEGNMDLYERESA